MKNIHVLPTDKPSNGYIIGKCIKDLSDVKIGQFTKTYYLMFDEEYFQPQNIYITSDEEIKEGDWYYLPRTNSVHKCKEDPTELNLERRLGVAKIILTTDQDLIKDGVQAIDDEFLEWFVNNPSCEFVKIQLEVGSLRWSDSKNTYKIIIPKEEPKQKTLQEEYLDNIINEANKEFTLDRKLAKEVAIKFAKWQSERMYSEEEVYKLLLKHQSDYRSSVRNSYPLTWSFDITQWFKQFKKK